MVSFTCWRRASWHYPTLTAVEGAAIWCWSERLNTTYKSTEKSVSNETKDWSSLMKKCLKEEVSVNSVFCLVSEGSHTSEGCKVWWLGTQGLDRSSVSMYDVKGNRKQSLPTAPSGQISKLQHLGKQDSSFFVRLYLLCSQVCRVYKRFAELWCSI